MKGAGRKPRARVTVIGIGSPFGNDAVGLEVARRLAREGLPGVEVIAADRPGLDLLELLDGREAVILIDAARTPHGRAGTLYEIDLRQEIMTRADARNPTEGIQPRSPRVGAPILGSVSRGASAPTSPSIRALRALLGTSGMGPVVTNFGSSSPETPVSSHTLGVAEALALAARLGRLPPRARLLAIDIGRRGRSSAGLSPGVERAIEGVVARVRRSLQSGVLELLAG